jgi:hypothetical protein
MLFVAAAARAKFEEARSKELELLDDLSLHHPIPPFAYPEDTSAVRPTAPPTVASAPHPRPEAPMGVRSGAWERVRDYCYIIQDSQVFQHTTTIVIILNAITLAIIW